MPDITSSFDPSEDSTEDFNCKITPCLWDLHTIILGSKMIIAGLEAFKGSSPEPSAADQMVQNLGRAAPEARLGTRVAVNAANLIRQNVQAGMAVSETRTGDEQRQTYHFE